MLLGPLAILALLLVAAGTSKLRAPGATATALDALGLRVGGTAAARAIGVAEVGAGCWALVAGDRWAALAVAGAHVVFSGVTFALLRRPNVPCGCFGAPDAPATSTGLVCNLASAVAAALAAVWPPGPLTASVRERPLEGVTLLVVVIVGGWLVHQVHTALPRLAVGR